MIVNIALEAHRATDFVKQFRRDSEPAVQELPSPSIATCSVWR